ncbi:MAG: hypothetical protein R2715_04895 [Ilumatobacteraceae bacterium]
MAAPSRQTPQEQYEHEIEARARRARRDVFLMRFGVQVTWAVTLVAGASVTLLQALNNKGVFEQSVTTMLSALAGFVVVIAQGTNRLLARGAKGATASDRFHRGIARERRLLAVRHGDYAVATDPLALYVERVEGLLAEDDAVAIETTQNLLAHDT